MIRRRIVPAMLIVCLVFTFCIGETYYAFADTKEVTQDTTVPDENEPEQLPEEIPVINDWDEEGFYHDAAGAIIKNKKMLIGDLVYSFDKSGKSTLYTGVYNEKYYKSGKALTGLRTVEGKTYYYKNGVRYTGLRTVEGKTYYYKSGVRYTGFRTVDGKSYYYKSGIRYTGFRIVDGKPYYYQSGKKVTTTYLYKNKCYKSGKKYTGIHKNYYYSSGTKVTKYKNTVRKINNGKFYYFKKDGSVSSKTGWMRLNGKRYYLKKGQACTGWNYIGDYKYYFHKNSASLCQDLIACQGSKWKKKDLYIKVNRTKNCVTIYAKDGKNGYIIPVKALICSVGKKSTPTIKGTYTMKAGSGKTYRWHLLGGPAIGADYCWGQYCVRIHKGWMFHSVTYDKKDKRTLQTYTYNNLGKAASHGCIRLQVKDAKLVYDIVKYRNTKVKIYDSDYTGPFDKPVIKKIPSKQKYDPTDPNI